jgi:hypothetical protein
MSIQRLRERLAITKRVGLQTATFVPEVEAALAEYDELIELLWNFTAPDDPCEFDHKGYCQAHSWLRREPECPHGRAKKILDAVEPARQAEGESGVEG